MTQPDNPQALIQVSDLGQFVHYLASWHSQKVAELQHMVDVPADTIMESEGIQLVLQGDTLEGFRAGLSLALVALGTLPFAVETEDAPVN